MGPEKHFADGEIPPQVNFIARSGEVIFVGTDNRHVWVCLFRFVFQCGNMGGKGMNGGVGIKIEFLFKSQGLIKRNGFKPSLPVHLFPNLNPHATVFNVEGVGTHHREIFGKLIFNCINGSEYPHKRHNTKSNYKHRKDSAQHMGPYRFKRKFYIFIQDFHDSFISYKNKK